MSNLYGEALHMTVFGQSHSAAIGVTLEGVPAGKQIDFEELSTFLSRRAPGKNAYSTARREADLPEFLCGFTDGNLTCGAPITAIIRNGDTRSQDYSALKVTPRPGHADYAAYRKFGDARDVAGGGQFSGRLTAPVCIAGGICLQLLREYGVSVYARIVSIGGIADEGELTQPLPSDGFPTVSAECGQRMQELIANLRSQGNSVGGVIECVAVGVPAGIGDPMFGGIENRISQVAFGIPAVKGIEFGAGFRCAEMTGLENNDAFTVRDGQVVTETNNAGGILGGITTGMPIVFRIAVKPTPSVSALQKSVNLQTMEESPLEIKGRHDPCIVPRAVPVCEAAAALAIYDAILCSGRA